jgi:hypothetical protein
LQFNRAKDYNAGTGMMADHVVVVRDNSNSTRLLAGVDAAGVYQYKSITNPATIVTIQVCAIVISTDTALVDYAILVMDQRLDSNDAQNEEQQAEQDVNAMCQLMQNQAPTPSAPTSATHHFTMSPTLAPVLQQPTPFVPVTTTSPVWANATTNATTDTPNFRQRIKDVVTFASTNRHSPDVTGIATVALAIVGVLLIGWARCWCRRRKRRAVAEAKPNGKTEENTIASFFSSVQLY